MEYIQSKEQDLIEAKNEITELKALNVLTENNDLACSITISGLRMNVCNNKWIVPIIKKQIKEIEKFIEGKENLWE